MVITKCDIDLFYIDYQDVNVCLALKTLKQKLNQATPY
ncbi:hypothetical protein C942_00710 [Photobacterium marinum]|uniref:Uncharacterized protein n=1 Tax=Photobacterium marinum TaxID=1056511 RepID=L8JDZ2_9GAMM|nr:hypothetical protein C942_00710 [Photobacterium marinum]